MLHDACKRELNCAASMLAKKCPMSLLIDLSGWAATLRERNRARSLLASMPLPPSRKS